MTYETLMEAAPLSPLAIVGCIAVIAVGVAVIMYVLFHAPKEGAAVGTRPEIGLGDDGDAPSDDADAEDAPAEDGEDAAEEEAAAPDEAAPAPADDAPAEEETDGQN